MGLDISHGTWSGAYSAFSRFRDKLAEVAGYDIVNTKDGSGWERATVCIDYGLWPEWAYYDPPYIPCRLDGAPDPLLLLILHSDCEGKIRHEFLEPLAKRLEELALLLEGQDGGGHIGDFAIKTQTFIAGVRLAASEGQDLEFH